MKAKDEKNELEKILECSNTVQENIPNKEDIKEINAEPAFDIDFDKLYKECEKQAKKMIKNSTGLLLSDGLIKQNPYLKDKMLIDIQSLSGLLYQLKSNETMQKALMEEVRHGAMHPRNFEVFTQLTKVIGDLNKQLIQTVEAIKGTYKDIKIDIEERTSEIKQLGQGNNGLIQNEEGMISYGTKELIKNVRARRTLALKEIDAEDAEEINNTK